MKYRLKGPHPANRALEKLCALAEELGIKINFMGVQTIFEYGGEEYQLQDNEDGRPVAEFPPQLEYKLTFEKEEDDERR